jgi:hypothetical protein
MRRSTSGQHHKAEQARAVVAQALGDAARARRFSLGHNNVNVALYLPQSDVNVPASG